MTIKPRRRAPETGKRRPRPSNGVRAGGSNASVRGRPSRPASEVRFGEIREKNRSSGRMYLCLYIAIPKMYLLGTYSRFRDAAPPRDSFLKKQDSSPTTNLARNANKTQTGRPEAPEGGKIRDSVGFAKKIGRRDACIYACIQHTHDVPTRYLLSFARRRSSPGLVFEKVGLRAGYKFSGELEYVFGGEVKSLQTKRNATLLEKVGKTVEIVTTPRRRRLSSRMRGLIFEKVGQRAGYKYSEEREYNANGDARGPRGG